MLVEKYEIGETMGMDLDKKEFPYYSPFLNSAVPHLEIPCLI